MQTTKSKALVSVSSQAGNYKLPLVQNQDNILVEARTLHSQLKVKEKFADWIKRRSKEYGFEKNKDFFTSEISEAVFKGGGHNRVEYHLTIDMAKELCMVERTEIGRKFRRFFIEAEKELRAKRLYAQTANITDITKKVHTKSVDGKKIYNLSQVRQLLGYSTKSSTSGIRKLNPGLISVVDGRCYVHEEYVRLLITRATARAQKEEAKNAKPILPIGFYSLQIQLELKQRGLA